LQDTKDDDIANFTQGSIDIVLTSPPYANQEVGKGIRPNRWEKIKDKEGFKGRKEWKTGTPSHYSDNKENIGNLPLERIDTIVTSPPYSESMTKKRKGYTVIPELAGTRHMGEDTKDENIANLPHGNVDAVITSPPYADVSKAPSRRDFWERLAQDPTSNRYGRKSHPTTGEGYGESKNNIGNLPLGSVDAVITSPPYGEAISKHAGGAKGLAVKKDFVCGISTREARQYSESEKNIGNLPLGDVDAIITSPPYADTKKGEVDIETAKKIAEKKTTHYSSGNFTTPGRVRGLKTLQSGYSESKENIGNLPFGQVDTIITSPPYGEAQEGSGIAKRGYQGSKHSPTDLVGKRSYMPDKFENPENISRLPLGKIDTIITSPPYQNTNHDTLEKRMSVPSGKIHMEKKGLPVGYSENPENIGNIKEHGSIDIILTSPPYADGKKAGEVKPEEVEKYAKRWEENVEKRNWNSWGKSFHTPGRLKGIKGLRDGYSNSKDNIGNLPFGHVDTIITSPPYSNIAKSKEGAISPHMQGLISKLSGIPVKDFALNIEKLKEAVKIAQSKIPFKYSDSPNNIGNLPLGNIDCCITSPPYEGSLEGTTRHTRGGIASRDPALAQTGTYATRLSFGVPVGYSSSKENIGNLKSSDEEYQALVDTVITSPPYAHESTASKPTKFEKQGLFKMGHSKEEPYTKEDYRTWIKHKNGNISKRKLFIRIPCKPEEAQFHDTREGRKGTIWEWTKEVEATPEIIQQMQNLKSEKKGKSETYLEAMLKVYGEMFQVLKPGGLAIIVVKPFIRNKKPVDLPYHTWLLMAKVGFNLVKLYKLRIKQHSFWRILQYRKFPEVPIIAHEYVLVCQKPSLEPMEVNPQVDPFEFLLESVARKKVSKIAKNLHN
jgi:hypothetical protein